MDSMAQPTVPPAVLAAMKEALGCMFIGLVLATGIYGISILQAYLYFRDSSHNATRYMRSFVAFLFILDTITMGLTVAGEWKNFVGDFGNPTLLLSFPSTLAIGNAFTVVIGTLTQCFFARRLWALSRRNFMLVASIVILALCSFGLGMALSVRLYQDNSTTFFGSFEVRILSGFSLGLSVICDVLIAAALSYYLHSKRTGFKRTDSMITQLIIYAVNRGALTAICLAAEMITGIALPGRFFFVPFGLLSGRLYCNTLLATLNAQKTMSREGDTVVELGSRVFHSTSTTSRHGIPHRSPGWGPESTSGPRPNFVVDITVEKTTDTSHTPSFDHSDV